jgi:DHA2 family multidrug resistance protein-like MFS transporter
MMPWPAAVIVVAPVSGWLADRFSTAWLCGVGGFLLAAAFAAAAGLISLSRTRHERR